MPKPAARDIIVAYFHDRFVLQVLPIWERSVDHRLGRQAALYVDGKHPTQRRIKLSNSAVSLSNAALASRLRIRWANSSRGNFDNGIPFSNFDRQN